jgi:hypothetical protein
MRRGASTRKTRHLQPNAPNAADAEGELRGLFCPLQARFPHSSTLQVGGKAHFALQNIFFKTLLTKLLLTMFIMPIPAQSGQVILTVRQQQPNFQLTSKL